MNFYLFKYSRGNISWKKKTQENPPTVDFSSRFVLIFNL